MNSNKTYTSAPRFSLKVLLIFLTVASIPFAIWGRCIEPYRQQAAAMERLESLPAWVGGADRNAIDKIEIVAPTSYAFEEQIVGITLGPDRWMRVRLLRLPAGTSESDVAFILSRMPFLEVVSVERTELTERTIHCLTAMPHLTDLELKYCGLQDGDASALIPAKSVERLVLTGNAVTDECFQPLSQLEQLKELYLRWTSVTESGVLSFQEQRSCFVYH